MLTRRRFLTTSATLLAGSAALPGCASEAARLADAQRKIWRHVEGGSLTIRELQRDLVRYATLAPSSHNTQCWRFKVEDRRISILPDFTRRCPAVDPDDHHLFVSLGCAAENLLQAAQANGLHADASFDPSAGALHVDLTPATPVSSPLFSAITRRQCTRAEYDGKLVSNENLKALEQVAQGGGVDVMLVTDRGRMDQILDYVLQGNSAQLQDRAFVDELESWIRFSDSEAVERGDGLFTACTGNPTAPRWLGRLFFRMFFTASNENEKYAKQVRSSAGIAVFASKVDDKAHWVEAGRCYERFALQATALGIHNAMLNQPVEVGSLRPQFASYLGVGGGRPDLVVRFGYGTDLPQSLRRPLDAVLV